MSKPHSSPDLLTTHNYITAAVDELGSEVYHTVEHKIATVVLDATSAIPMPHTLEANVTVPVIQDAETRAIKPSGKPRILTVKLYTDLMPERTGFHPGSNTRHTTNSSMEERQLAAVTFRFNTRRLLGVYGTVPLDGEKIGFDQDVIDDPTNKNFLLAYLAAIGDFRSLNVTHAAEFVASASMQTAQSTENLNIAVNLEQIARNISRATDMPVPESLQYGATPSVLYEGTSQISSVGDIPTTSVYNLSVDRYDEAAKARIMTDWSMTRYDLYVPNETDHLGVYQVHTADGEPTATSFGIDARQVAVGSGLNHGWDNETYARTPEEAREMVSPLIHAVTSLRRFHNKAIKKL